MKKLTLLLFGMFLAFSLSTQAQAKKSLEGALKHAALTQQETVKVLAIQKEKSKEIKAIRKEKLEKEAESTKIKAVKKAASAKIRKIIGKEKVKAINEYWKKKK